MKYAIKITEVFLGIPMVRYQGARGEMKKSLDKVEGWKKRETAEKYIENHESFDVFTGRIFGERNYEIIEIRTEA